MERRFSVGSAQADLEPPRFAEDAGACEDPAADLLQDAEEEVHTPFPLGPARTALPQVQFAPLGVAKLCHTHEGCMRCLEILPNMTAGIEALDTTVLHVICTSMTALHHASVATLGHCGR